MSVCLWLPDRSAPKMPHNAPILSDPRPSSAPLPTAAGNLSKFTWKVSPINHEKRGKKSGLLSRILQLLPLNQRTSVRKAIRGTSLAISQRLMRQQGHLWGKKGEKCPNPIGARCLALSTLPQGASQNSTMSQIRSDKRTGIPRKRPSSNEHYAKPVSEIGRKSM
jgi:hypothetical protein